MGFTIFCNVYVHTSQQIHFKHTMSKTKHSTKKSTKATSMFLEHNNSQSERERHISQWSELSWPSKQNPSCLHGCECTTVIDVHPEHTGAGSLMAAPLFPHRFTMSAKWPRENNEPHVQHTEKDKKNPQWRGGFISIENRSRTGLWLIICNSRLKRISWGVRSHDTIISITSNNWMNQIPFSHW